MTAWTQPTQLVYGCSWFSYRLNVVPWGAKAVHMPSQFVDGLEDARRVKAEMVAGGADEVHIYDTVEGSFWQ